MTDDFELARAEADMKAAWAAGDYQRHAQVFRQVQHARSTGALAPAAPDPVARWFKSAWAKGKPLVLA